MQFDSNAPQWARDLYLQVMLDNGVESPPPLRWRRSKTHRLSSGSTAYNGSRVVVTAGKDRRDQRLVLLHESAHVLTIEDRAHSERFWITAFALYKRYAPNIPQKYVVEREGAYRVEALKVAAAMGVRGAKTALAKRRR